MRKITFIRSLMAWTLLSFTASGYPMRNHTAAEPEEAGPYTFDTEGITACSFTGNFIYTDYAWCDSRTPDFKGDHTIHRDYKFTLSGPMRVTAHTFGSDVMNIRLHLLRHIGNDVYELIRYSDSMLDEARENGWPVDELFMGSDFVGMANIMELYRAKDQGYLHDLLPAGEYLLVAEGVARKMQTDIGRIHVTIRGVDAAERPVPYGCRGQDPFLGFGFGDISVGAGARVRTGLTDFWRVSGGPGVDAHFYFRVVDRKQSVNIAAIPFQCTVNSISVYRDLGNYATNHTGYGNEIADATDLPQDDGSGTLVRTLGNLLPGVYLVIVNANPEPGAMIDVRVDGCEPEPEPEPEPDPNPEPDTATGEDFENAIGLGVFEKDFDCEPAAISSESFFPDRDGRKNIYHRFEVYQAMQVEINHDGSDLAVSDIELYRYHDVHTFYPDRYFPIAEDRGLLEGRKGKVRINLSGGLYFIKSSIRQNEKSDMCLRIKGNASDFERTVLKPDQSHAYTLTVRPSRDLPNAEWACVFGDAAVTVEYFDGLGRPRQTVRQAYTPDECDLITHNEYDRTGKLTRQWLPVVRIRGNSGGYTGLDTLRTFANSTYAERAFTDFVYAASNFERIEKAYRPGDAWIGKFARVDYRFNEAAGDYACLRFDVVGSRSAHSLAVKGFYEPGTIYVEESVDEDHHRTISFCDFNGQRLLVRRVLASGAYADTYSVFDDFGNLCYVLSPMGTAAILSDDIDTALSDYAYRYYYDEKNRCIEKRLPGAEPIRFVYDRKGDVILHQDGNSAKEDKWMFTIPDKMGRTVLEGICGSIPGIRTILADSIIRAGFDAERVGSYLYRHNAPFHVADTSILQVAYYDNYRFLERLPDLFDPRMRLDSNEIANPYTKGLRYDMTAAENTPRPFFGQSTGKISAVMDNPTLKTAAASYYDFFRRLVQKKSTTPVGGLMTVDTRYDFQGNVLINRERHFMPGAADPDELLCHRVYNRKGLPVFGKWMLNGGPAAIVRYAYDDLNRVVGKKYGSGRDTLSESFAYNIHGWPVRQKSRLFEAGLKYADPDLPTSDGGKKVSPSFTGNITQWHWRHFDQENGELPQNSYGFAYDELNRLADTYHFIRSTPASDWTRPAIPLSERDMRYDLNGNILTLTRHAKQSGSSSTAAADVLIFDYAGNRLRALDHNNLSGSLASGGNFGYTYDANGNMISDRRKGLNFRYNCLNLMEEASDSLGWVDYAWLADGTKVSVEDQYGNGYLYAGSLVYSRRDGNPWKIESASFDAGRIIATESSAGGNEIRSSMPLYQLKDHLGSVRTVFTLADGAARVIAQNDYYPLGMRHYAADMALGSDAQNRYLFGGKEEQVTGSLGLLDFGARMYDPLTGRWSAVDPLSEKYFGVSPYVFCAGNPVNRIDPNGKKWVDVKGREVWKEGKWTKFATNEIRELGNTLRKTRTGEEQFRKLVENEAAIQVVVSDAEEAKAYGKMDPKGGVIVNNKTGKAKINSGAEITIYRRKAEERSNMHNGFLTPLEAMAVNFGHEIEHTTDENIQMNYEITHNIKDHDIEAVPNAISDMLIKQYELKKSILPKGFRIFGL